MNSLIWDNLRRANQLFGEFNKKIKDAEASRVDGYLDECVGLIMRSRRFCPAKEKSSLNNFLASVITTRGVMNIRQGREKEGEEDLRLAAEIDPENVFVLHELMLLENVSGRFLQAVEYGEKASAIAVREKISSAFLAEIRFNLGLANLHLYAREKNPKRAAAAVENFVLHVNNGGGTKIRSDRPHPGKNASK
jgi:tetratricopeptide (TPR) repeat protein